MIRLTEAEKISLLDALASPGYKRDWYVVDAATEIVTARLAAVEVQRDDALMRLAEVRALAARLERPLAGLRQRANTNEDFAEAALMESERRSIAGRLRAVLDAPARDEGTPCSKHRARGVNPTCGDCDQAPARDESEAEA